MRKKIAVNQFASREGSDCSLAKLRFFYIAKQKGLRNALLIDVRKAYDSVDLNKLIEGVKDQIGRETDETMLISNMVEIYKLLTMCIKSKVIHPRIGIPREARGRCSSSAFT